MSGFKSRLSYERLCFLRLTASVATLAQTKPGCPGYTANGAHQRRKASNGEHRLPLSRSPSHNGRVWQVVLADQPIAVTRQRIAALLYSAARVKLTAAGAAAAATVAAAFAAGDALPVPPVAVAVVVAAVGAGFAWCARPQTGVGI